MSKDVQVTLLDKVSHDKGQGAKTRREHRTRLISHGCGCYVMLR